MARSAAVVFVVSPGASLTGQIDTRGSPNSVVSGEWLCAVRTKRAGDRSAAVIALGARWPEVKVVPKHSSSRAG